MIKIKITLFLLLLLGGATLLFLPKTADKQDNITIEESKKNIPAETNEALDKLRTMPYVAWSTIKKDDLRKSGVIKYDPKLFYSGINLYCSRKTFGGYLMDMSGHILHEFIDKRKQKNGEMWHLLEPYDQDLFLVIIEGEELFMIDGNSNIRWINKLEAHHDIAISDNGDIYTLSLKRKKDTRFKLDEQILDNTLAILSKDGTIKKEILFSDLISENTKLLHAAKDNRNILQPYLFGKDALNIFHTNTVEIIDREILRDGNKIFSRGNVLFCMRNINTIGVLDVDKEKIIWSWGIEELDCPHSPTLLSNGNILIFDNGTFRGYSRVIEIDPFTGQIMWEYKGDPPDSFYSHIMGSVQRLPNGNTLICNSVSGQVFEVTPEGDIAWEFWNTDIDMKAGGKRASIYRFIRIPEQEYSLSSKGQTIWHRPGRL